MISRLETVYDATVRRVGPLHAVARETVWAAGDLAVRAVRELLKPGIVALDLGAHDGALRDWLKCNLLARRA